MPKTQPKLDNVWEIHVPKDIAVAVDDKTLAKSIAFPVNYPDGYHGYIIMVKGVRMKWTPSEDVSSIVINFKA